MRLSLLTPTATVHKQAKVNYLSDRHISHSLKFAYKGENRLQPTRATRTNVGPMLKYVRAKKQIARCSVEYKAENLWNKLPPAKRLIEDYKAFCSFQSESLSHKLLN